jgi:histidine ammonia-lyase
VAGRLRALLSNSAVLEASRGDRTQDPLSLRAIPHVHGAALDVFAMTEAVINRELRAVTDNPVVTGTVEAPVVYSEAHAVPAALALALDSLAIATASVAAMSERRIDRLVNPLVSRLPAFLSDVAGVGSGLMIAQYTAASLVAENRRLAAPASLDGGITSGLQEDHLCHSTPAALKLLEILDNFECILSIELLAAAQGFEQLGLDLARAPATARIQRAIRDAVPPYRDDRPLADDFARIRHALLARHPEAVQKAI